MSIDAADRLLAVIMSSEGNMGNPLAVRTWLPSVRVLAFLLLGTVCAFWWASIARGTSSASGIPSSIHKIQHVIIIMQENRSFDEYFGTYPGADGIPMQNGVPTVCVPDPEQGTCVAPYHSKADINFGAPHGNYNSQLDTDGGKMDGFVNNLQNSSPSSLYFPSLPQGACGNTFNPVCAGGGPDVMGYHDRGELPNYWAYADNYVLQDHMFEPTTAYSLTSHLYMVSGWSAQCSRWQDPTSCTNSNAPQNLGPGHTGPHSSPNYAWTDITYLLDQHHVSWKYYVDDGTKPYCTNYPPIPRKCNATDQKGGTPELWNPLPFFTTVQKDRTKGNIQTTSQYLSDAQHGTLPNVAWIVPSPKNSDHPAAAVSASQSYVTTMINAAMQGPEWNSTAIFLAWDDWGGFYDHVSPPQVDGNGYGIRVPGLLISPYAKRNYIDHQTLTFDAYLKFIEDDFLGGQAIDPANDGRPDGRPDVRERAPGLGDLLNDFNFNHKPRGTLVLPEQPQTDLESPAQVAQDIGGANLDPSCVSADAIIGAGSPQYAAEESTGLHVTIVTTGSTTYTDKDGAATSQSAIKLGSLVTVQGTRTTQGGTVTVTASNIQVLDGMCPTAAAQG